MKQNMTEQAFFEKRYSASLLNSESFVGDAPKSPAERPKEEPKKRSYDEKAETCAGRGDKQAEKAKGPAHCMSVRAAGASGCGHNTGYCWTLREAMPSSNLEISVLSRMDIDSTMRDAIHRTLDGTKTGITLIYPIT